MIFIVRAGRNVTHKYFIIAQIFSGSHQNIVISVDLVTLLDNGNLSDCCIATPTPGAGLERGGEALEDCDLGEGGVQHQDPKPGQPQCCSFPV